MLRYLALAFIGFVNALPLPLAGTVLTVWLKECGFTKELVGLFALCAIPFNFKIIWMPIIEQFSLPFSKGRERKAWLLFALLGMALIFFGISFINPQETPWLLALCLVFLTLFRGCLYIVGLAYEIESLDKGLYASGSACVITGYRFGLLCAGAGGLYIATFWDWATVFQCASFIVLLGSCLILWLKEPFKSGAILKEKRQEFARYSSIFIGFWHETILKPCQIFIQNKQWLTILLLLLSFKIGDELIKNMITVFYLSLGFQKTDLATITSLWGMAATIAGTTFAGFILKGKDHFLALVKTGTLHALALGSYVVLAIIGKSIPALYLVVGIENFTSGMAITALISFLWKVSGRRYAAVHYALLWSFFTFKGHLLTATGGFLAAHLDWPSFFLTATVLGVTSSLLAWRAVKTEEKIYET